MNSVHTVLFFNGQSKVVADIFFETAPEGFDVSWKPYQLGNEEKANLIRNVEFLVLHPAEISGSLLREAKSLRLIQLLTAGYDKVDLATAAELGIPVATNGGANAWGVAEQSRALLCCWLFTDASSSAIARFAKENGGRQFRDSTHSRSRKKRSG
jgi:lactate dehydrogenase-like 2-hydroxyacid dehydrogenase